MDANLPGDAVKNFHLKALFIYIICCLFLTCIGCERSDAEKIGEYILSTNAAGDVSDLTPESLKLPGEKKETTTIVQGIPVSHGEGGFCGDGVLKVTEDCDLDAIPIKTCRELGGLSGRIGCQPNCRYDVSDCITSAVDSQISGITETCDCYCDQSECRGGCAISANANTASAGECDFYCDQDCTCNCEGKLEANLQNCVIRCLCGVNSAVSPTGAPDCACTVAQCQVLAIIGPHIATKVALP